MSLELWFCTTVPCVVDKGLWCDTGKIDLKHGQLEEHKEHQQQHVKRNENMNMWIAQHWVNTHQHESFVYARNSQKIK